MPADAKPGLTVKEVAARCFVSRRTVYAWRDKSYGPPHFKFGGRVYYREDDVNAWLNAQTRA